MPKFFLPAALLTAAALVFAAPARAQVIINVGRPAPPPPVVVVREYHQPRKWKAPKRYYYQPRPVMLVPAQPVYYAPRGYGHGHGRGHGHGHGRH
ncbi:hypothetical protein [Hymenobacter rigui]|uniref:Virulence factor n=1 Tax=Hymenobacter rigui TaxID=334424 RepID=A0A428KBD6_9BACT|nr:hypothetical protein [Hymenobacter rigui]RSK43747.1 hypothetical protein EI291_21815 [Hymenobacter rigui]